VLSYDAAARREQWDTLCSGEQLCAPKQAAGEPCGSCDACAGDDCTDGICAPDSDFTLQEHCAD